MKTSFHYLNLAMDLRTSDLPKDRVQEYHDNLIVAFGPKYVVVIEGDHLHVQPPHGSQGEDHDS
jgi:hypothetical protein